MQHNVHLLQIRLHLIAIEQYVQMGSVILNLCEVTSTTFTKWSALHLEYCKCCRWTMVVRHLIPCNCGVHGWKICIKVLRTKYLDFVDEVAITIELSGLALFLAFCLSHLKNLSKGYIHR